jgi:hypothetical protein
MLGRETCPGLVAGVAAAAVRVVEGGLVAAEAVECLAAVPLTTEGVGDETFFTSVDATVALFAAALARNGALVVVVERVDGRPAAAGRGAGLSEVAVADTVPATGPAVALRVGAVDVLAESAAPLGGVLVFEEPTAVVEGPGGFRPAAADVVFGAVAVPATEGRALPGTLLSAVEVTVVFKGARVVEALPPSVVRGFASAVTLALGLRGAAAVGLGAVSADGEECSTGDPSTAGLPVTAPSLSTRSSFSSKIESPSACPFAGCAYSPCSASWVRPGACAGIGSRTAIVIAFATRQELTTAIRCFRLQQI